MVRPGALPGPGGWSVAVQDLGLVLVPGSGGAIRIDHEGPAALVDHHLVVVPAQEDAVSDAGLAAVGFVAGVVDLACSRGLPAAAGPFAVLTAEADRVADTRRDGLAVADVQRQAGAAEPGVELLTAEERRDPAGSGQQLDRLADDRLHQGLPGPVSAVRRTSSGGRTTVGGRVREAAVRIAAVTVIGSVPVVVLVLTGFAEGVLELVELGAQPDQVSERGRVEVPDDHRGDRRAARDPFTASPS